MSDSRKAKHICQCLQLAMLLEVSTKKPGNVNFNDSFADTRAEHFLASAVAAAPALEEAANQGIAVAEGKISPSEVGMGNLIKTCVSDIMVWQHGGNTLLGTIMLLVPLATAAGMTKTRPDDSFDLTVLRENVKLLVESTTATDAVCVYDAVEIASPSGLNQSSDLDVNDPQSKQRLLTDNITLLQVFKIGASYDDICSEWVNNYPITFTQAYPYLKTQLQNGRDLTGAVVHTFLKILSEHPDTFIARKVSVEAACEVAAEAGIILALGGLDSEGGKIGVEALDERLRSCGNKLNPGTTADLTAAALALAVLGGYRP
ncbi:MAG: triphosphoribosyl-dephospho-CoA synthase [Candidatus Bathyarchaeota archaeon]|nr:triphosphoribosyl-dephospho-CoA synthase [Candidatus Bathyarchaeota archaeon]